eukprot:1160008-Pelagomonas_calceolata.AAC.5
MLPEARGNVWKQSFVFYVLNLGILAKQTNQGALFGWFEWLRQPLQEELPEVLPSHLLTQPLYLLDKNILPHLFSIITQAHTVNNELQAAAATVIAGISMGKDSKEQRPKIRDESYLIEAFTHAAALCRCVVHCLTWRIESRIGQPECIGAIKLSPQQGNSCLCKPDSWCLVHALYWQRDYDSATPPRSSGA